jgi:hypothetical protein
MIDGTLLNQFACDCAEQRYFKRCNMQCTSCPSNVSLYCGLSKEEAVALQHSANISFRAWAAHEAAWQKRERGEHRTNRFLAGIWIALGILWVLFMLGLYHWNKKADPAPGQQAEDILPLVAPIVDTLERIYRADIDGDGKISCIDYALQFYNAYPNREDVRLVVNYNKETGYNHLFVKVRGVAVEPVSLLKPKPGNPVGIIDYWGAQWDPAWDRDVTAHVEQIRIGGYWDRGEGNVKWLGE